VQVVDGLIRPGVAGRKKGHSFTLFFFVFEIRLERKHDTTVEERGAAEVKVVVFGYRSSLS
jgi:hypothetical protein